jgi:hypothetical protein
MILTLRCLGLRVEINFHPNNIIKPAMQNI